MLEAENGAEALARVGVDPIDLVVLDVRLPDLSGFEVCERIKADHPAMPVIHVSAHAVDVVDRTQGLTRGADAYLAEPIEPEELVATAHAVLRYYQARQRAELLAERLPGLADTTVAVHAASTFTRLLRRRPPRAPRRSSAARRRWSPRPSTGIAWPGSRRSRRDAAGRTVGGRRHRRADRRDRPGGRPRGVGVGATGRRATR